MFFCRRLPLITRQLTNPAQHTALYLSTSASSRIHPNAPALVSRETNARMAAQRAFQRLVRESSARQRKSKATTRSTAELDAYLELRSRYKSHVHKLPLWICVRLWQQTLTAEATDIMQFLSEDLVQVPASRDDNLMIRLLAADTQPERKSVLEILQRLKPRGKPMWLPPDITKRLVEMVMRGDATSAQFDGPILNLLTPIIINAVSIPKVPAGLAAITHTPPPIARFAFEVLRKLLVLDQQDVALALFRTLVKNGNIPAESIQALDEEVNDFNMILRATLIRACFHWSWRDLATTVLDDYIASSRSLSGEISTVILDALHAFLESPTGGDVASFATIFLQLHHDPTKPSEMILPDALIRLFYRSAHQVKRLDMAESVYTTSRRPEVMRIHEYPPPGATALTPFLLYLVKVSRKPHIARVLSAEIANSSDPIPSFDRAKFIAGTAQAGNGIVTEALWERYAVGRDASAVVGDSTAMLRVVSLFAGIIKQTREKLKSLDEQGQLFLAQTDSTSIDAESEDFPVMTIGFYTARLAKLNEFMNRVYDEYKALKEPVQNAHHFAISTMARALISMGRHDDALSMLKHVTDRKELPDRVDINIALTALSDIDPASAATMLKVMDDKGLQPDPLAFGTVIARAASRGDHQLVDTLTSWMQENEQGMTTETVSAIVQASVKAAQDASGHGAVDSHSLDRILRIFHTGSPQLRTVPNGKASIMAALRAGQPELAYKLWVLIIKDHAEWEDREQRFHRRLIADSTKRYMKKGRISRERGMMILRDLRE